MSINVKCLTFQIHIEFSYAVIYLTYLTCDYWSSASFRISVIIMFILVLKRYKYYILLSLTSY